ncbi:hypothetical protein B4N89_28425 [Embleya scabrispora]|uniref:Terminal beta-(1->2)-arabinofuranosyltransferase C-terminal domain-containing protein n=1 Tax=Embleya scabrispora TaxID=159449 RepID=A0A1T3P5K0_9ACTN|nr:hypothetical protein [Embleya scabrispora]OPC84334.1 hypothetical protein B4N89_28425 [Embleya scabrispora]
MTPPPGTSGPADAARVADPDLQSPTGEPPSAPEAGTADTPAAPTRPTAERRRARVPLPDLLALGLPTLVFAIMGWHQRWITDDGLIFTRAVREILAGNGPVYSAGERVETSTSTLWQWLLALLGGITPFDYAPTAVYTGLILSVAGLWLSLDGTRRLFRGLAVTRLLLPAGVLVFIAVPSVWDFATAGMETGLILFWIGLSWWLLIGTWLRPVGTHTTRHTLALSFWFGLGPLVRPDLGLTMVILLVAQFLLIGARWPKALAMLACAGFLPAAYEIFRMGYYGLIFPMPALTKEASGSLWGRGWDYLTDYMKPYYLWIPMILIVVAVALALTRRRPADRRTWIVIGTPLVAALGQTVYVLKVGGDFMHGRMWLPVLLLVLLPLLLAPLDRLVTPVIVLVAVWAVVCGSTLRSGVITTPAPDGNGNQVWNERDTYAAWTRTDNPTTEEAHIRTLPTIEEAFRNEKATGERLLFVDPNYMKVPPLPLRTDLDHDKGLVIGRLGVGGSITPLGGIVVDVWGLSNTVGAHITETRHTAAGHKKLLPFAWNVALYVDPAGDALVPPDAATQEDIRAARAALRCGDLAELVDSVGEPMSASRFWKNLTGAVDRTKLRIPANPIEAEKKFCSPS